MDVMPVVPINLFRLTLLTENDDKTLQFCRNIGMFPKDITCPNCGVLLEKVYKIKNRNTTHFRYQCNKRMCHGKHKQNTVTLRGHTWFNEAKISIRKSLFITYCFIYQLSYKDTIRETSISNDQNRNYTKTSSETVCDYKRYCRDICYNIIVETSSNKIGGPNCTVEIDESKFGETKYHKGRYIKGQWVFGGICRQTKQFFLVPVERRDKETLIPIITERIANGTTIMSDCWKSCDCLSTMDFEHLTINHSYNFVDPNTEAHTQNIENLWWQIKRQLPETYTRHEQLYLHLSEYIWRKCKKDNCDLFMEFMRDAAKYVSYSFDVIT